MRLTPLVRRSAALLAAAAFALPAQAPLQYPDARKSGTVDLFFGTSVADPYRWLENTSSDETRTWIAAENKVTFAYLQDIPQRRAIFNRLEQLWDFPRAGIPVRRQNFYFYSFNSGLQDQPVIYFERTSNHEKRVVLDPNKLSSEGTTAVTNWSPSRDARKLAYAVSVKGSDWQEIRVRDIESGKDYTDTLHWAKFTRIAWTNDSRGFFYSRYAAVAEGDSMLTPSKGQKLYYHSLGTPQSKDVLIWERPDRPEWYVNAEVSDDGEFCIISIAEGTSPNNRLYYIDLNDPTSPKVRQPVVKLMDLRQALRCVDHTPCVAVPNVPQDAGERIKACLEQAGATVELRPA